MPEALEPLLRGAVESGDWARVGERLSATAVMETSNEAGRRRIDGAGAISAHLSRPGPGTIHDWDVQEWDTGVALSFEWHGASGTDRRRWYLRAGDGGEITELWSVAARPRTGESAEAVAPPERLLAQLGATRAAALSHGGNSGAALLRAERDDGTAFILKRVSAGGSDWLARATDDRGRTAQLHEAGVFERMPPAIGHGIVAVEHAEDGAWIAMRDVGRCSRPTRGCRASRAGGSWPPRPTCTAPSRDATCRVRRPSPRASGCPHPRSPTPSGPTRTCCPSSSSRAGMRSATSRSTSSPNASQPCSNCLGSRSG